MDMCSAHSKATNTCIVGLSAWSPSGDELATGSVDHTAKVWNVNPGELLYSLEGHQDHVSSVAWNPRYDWLATGSIDGTAALEDVTCRNIIARLSGNSSGPLLYVAWNLMVDLWR